MKLYFTSPYTPGIEFTVSLYRLYKVAHKIGEWECIYLGIEEGPFHFFPIPLFLGFLVPNLFPGPNPSVPWFYVLYFKATYLPGKVGRTFIFLYQSTVIVIFRLVFCILLFRYIYFVSAIINTTILFNYMHATTHVSSHLSIILI